MAQPSYAAPRVAMPMAQPMPGSSYVAPPVAMPMAPASYVAPPVTQMSYQQPMMMEPYGSYQMGPQPVMGQPMGGYPVGMPMQQEFFEQPGYGMPMGYPMGNEMGMPMAPSSYVPPQAYGVPMYGPPMSDPYEMHMYQPQQAMSYIPPAAMPMGYGPPMGPGGASYVPPAMGYGGSPYGYGGPMEHDMGYSDMGPSMQTMVVTGPDMNMDGIPDVLQQPGGMYGGMGMGGMGMDPMHNMGAMPSMHGMPQHGYGGPQGFHDLSNTAPSMQTMVVEPSAGSAGPLRSPQQMQGSPRQNLNKSSGLSGMLDALSQTFNGMTGGSTNRKSNKTSRNQIPVMETMYTPY